MTWTHIGPFAERAEYSPHSCIIRLIFGEIANASRSIGYTAEMRNHGKVHSGKVGNCGDDELHFLNGVKQTVRSDYLHAQIDNDIT
jgi:hypothetical protein